MMLKAERALRLTMVVDKLAIEALVPTSRVFFRTLTLPPTALMKSKPMIISYLHSFSSMRLIGYSLEPITILVLTTPSGKTLLLLPSKIGPTELYSSLGLPNFSQAFLLIVLIDAPVSSRHLNDELLESLNT